MESGDLLMRIGILEHGCGCMTRHEKSEGERPGGRCVREATWESSGSSGLAGGRWRPAFMQGSCASVRSAMPAFPPELHIRTIIVY